MCFPDELVKIGSFPDLLVKIGRICLNYYPIRALQFCGRNLGRYTYLPGTERVNFVECICFDR